MVATIEDVVEEIQKDKPRTLPGLLSREERMRLIERAFHSLYRWYMERSQVSRNWNPDRDFDWKHFRKDHSDKVVTILQGFFAVEQYTPDYVCNIMHMIRQSHGRSHYLLRWGAEEERHANLWQNALMFSGRRSAEWMENYMVDLRTKEWNPPWEDPLHMLFYQTIQERATQINYLNLAIIARGEGKPGEWDQDADPVLLRVCSTIAMDEAAHYDFFLESARLFLYYFPEESVEALADVLKYFAMPAMDIIPNYDDFGETIVRAGIYGPRIYAKDVVQAVLNNMGIESRKALENGIRQHRQVPNPDGQMVDSAIFNTLDYGYIEKVTQRLFGRIHKYEERVGLDQVQPTKFVPMPSRA